MINYLLLPTMINSQFNLTLKVIHLSVVFKIHKELTQVILKGKLKAKEITETKGLTVKQG